MSDTQTRQANSELLLEHQRAGINTDIGTVVPESMKNRADLVGAADTLGIRQNYIVGAGTTGIMSSENAAFAKQWSYASLCISFKPKARSSIFAALSSVSMSLT